MRKVAFFVEGQTERVFVESLLENYPQGRPYSVHSKRVNGGGRREKILISITTKDVNGADLFILIVDCGSGSRVVSELNEQYSSLVRSGYSEFVVLLDIRPHAVADEGKLRLALNKSITKGPVTPMVILAVPEIESWFLAEYSHYRRIDRRIRLRIVNEKIKSDVRTVIPSRAYPVASGATIPSARRRRA